MNKLLLGLGSLAVAAPSMGAPVYLTSQSVAYDPAAPTSNFGAPTNRNNETAYTVQTGIDANFFYVDVTATPPAGASVDQFANLYLGGPTISNGIVIEATNSRFQITGSGGPYYSLLGTGYSYTAVPNDIALAIPLSFLEIDAQGSGKTNYNAGDLIRVSLSQSFGYSVAGGPTYYPAVTRLGAQVIPASPSAAAVPELGVWMMMITGFGVVGLAMRRRLHASEVKFTDRIRRIAAGEIA